MDSNQPPEDSNLYKGGDSSTSPSSPNQIDLNKRCKITNVHFEGVKKTRPTLLAKMVADIFPSTSLIDFLERFMQVKQNLMSLNAFNKIDIEVNPVERIADGSNDHENYEVTLIVEEKGFITASAQTAVDNHSTHISLQVGLPNLNGIGDTMSLSSKFYKRFYHGEFRYSIPITPWRELWAPRYSISCSQYQLDAQPSGFDQEDKALINQIDFFSLPRLNHSLSFENIWRLIKCSSIKTPIEVREQCGHSLKSSIKHQLTYDTRILGLNYHSEGILAKLTNEITTNLVNGGVRFNRNELNLQANALLLPKYDLLFQVNLLAGTLFRAQKVSICDKFFAGGPLTLRGFKLNGLETVRGHPLGDMSYLSAGAHVYSILPFTKLNSQINNYVRPHIFFNTGTIGSILDIRRLNSRDDFRREIYRFRDSLRYSCGFGLVMYFMSLRLEINYCVPIVFKKDDLTTRGLQWGFGLSYS